MKKALLMTAVMFMTAFWAFAQQRTFWTRSSPDAATQLIQGRASASNFEVFELDIQSLKDVISQAPVRGRAASQEMIISFPTPDGTVERFSVIEASVLHPDLAAKYPGIKSYAGQGIDDPTATIRFSVSNQRGFHGMVLSSARNSFYIDPYSEDLKLYSVFERASMSSTSDFQCMSDEMLQQAEQQSDYSTGRTNDKKLRKYRLALSCNAEYGNIFAGSSGTDADKKGRILAQMNITMTRVNGIYERDLAITMEIIPTNDRIIYYGSTSSDPWSNEWNSKTQQVIDSQIGNANYDIGHNFNTTGGGNAGCIGCVCTTGSKGSGYTGRSDPTGDAFDIDYVAHEMGHQFGGYHTQSNSSCRSGSGTTEVEPGSGSTIMGYAGICAANVQNNSDAYFAYVNIRDISANVQTGTSSGCAQVVNLVNNPPTANAGADYTIPKSTAFTLTGQGSDPDGDALTYTWEQNDPGNPNSNSAPTSTRTVGPMFRSYEGTASPTRVFPQMSSVVANNLTPTWEVIPSVGRTLNFSLTVRDNKAGGGQTSDDLMRVTVSGTAGPFVVTAPNTAVSWSAGSTQTVTWNVASTNTTPINCANVNIKLSTDGGYTYPITILANTPNDGSQAITVPNNTGTSCRIMIESVGNIFFDISNTNFTITPGATCNATVPTGLSASNVSTTGATLSWNAVSGATYDVQYRATGTTTWTTLSASNNSIAISGLASGTQYEAQVRSKCSSTTSAYSTSVTFTTTAVQTCTATVPTGLSASNVTSSGATLNWNAVSGTTYDVQYRATGTTSWTTVSTSTNSTTLSGLASTTQYEAQVRSKCPTTTSAYSASVTFTTSTIQITYCASKGNNVSDEYVGRVQIGTINNATGANGGYGNFTSLSTNLNKGSAYTITVTPTWTGTTYNEGYAAWIDYNNDGDFTDSGEQVWSRSASKTTPVSGTFTVPSSASDGAKRLRVSMKYNGIPTSCETFSYGEVEDYTVNLQTVTSTCTDVTLTLKLDNYPEETSWSIKNASGTTVASGGTYGSSADGSTITATNCLPDGCYTFTINDTYGDGICCTYGSGSYTLKDASGTTLASGASFTSSMTHNFCVGSGSKTGRSEEFAGVMMTESSAKIISPNPVKDMMKLRLKEKAEIRSVTITATSGKLLRAVIADDKTLDVSSLPSGMYVLTIETTKGIIKEKFIKE